VRNADAEADIVTPPTPRFRHEPLNYLNIFAL
jgi:hypothetical protein